MRNQSKANRAFGVTAGQQRRIAAGNREEISQDRRAQVFRQDVPHAGVEPGDALRARRAAAWALVPQLAAENKTLSQIAGATGLAAQTIRNYLSKHQIPCRDFKPQGRRQPRVEDA